MPSRTGLRLAMSALAIVLGLAAGTAYSQATKSLINAVANTTYPPFEFKDPTTNRLVGFDIDLLDAIAAKMGAKVNLIESKFDQLLSSIVTKRADDRVRWPIRTCLKTTGT
ncbi:transporter substrate-binding domain-containing protein [Bradyrhizobium sp. Pha-3]|uniref:transporter substrate-binding domain-containing protein n=1 Tax=Bradyrhizobium sp. Pha-3 TaxID=208375 RepID=UPI0035D5055F